MSMTASPFSRIESIITNATGQASRVTGSRATSGGCINDSQIVTLQDGREFFIKTHAGADDCPGMFETEFLALKLLAAPGVIHVPRPVAFGGDYLVVEAFREGARAADWEDQMGRRLARLHQATRQEQFGFEKDNYLGTTPQPNGWWENWTDFWREKRLGWQLELVAAKTSPDDPLLQSGRQLMDRLDSLLDGVREPAVLLHGDLWSGNAAANEQGSPVIFDPASYYGHREAELGMMRLFGGFGPRCEAAYQEVWPLEVGADERIALYRLYHELNHLNLFGRAYYQACMSTIRSLL